MSMEIVAKIFLTNAIVFIIFMLLNLVVYVWRN